MHASEKPAAGPSVLAGRPCGFSCQARCRWSYFRKLAGTRGPASQPSIVCAARQNVGVSRAARGVTARPKSPPLGSRVIADTDSAVQPLTGSDESQVKQDDVQLLRSLSWWLSIGLVGLVGLMAGNRELLALGASSSQPVAETAQHALGGVWDAYSSLVDFAPLATKAGISGATFLLADLSSQAQDGRGLAGLDRQRLLRCTLIGLLLHGPMLHVFFEKLERFSIVSKYFQGGDAWWLPFIKVAVDQTLWAAAWNASYLLALGLSNGKKPGRLARTLPGSTLDLVKGGWRIWPLAHLITYTAIPLQHRLLWVDCVELVWASVLSLHGSQVRQRGLATAMEQTQPKPAPGLLPKAR